MPSQIAMISEHASPLAEAGGVDAGGQNIYVAHTARHLANLGYCVDVFTRRNCANLPDVVELAPGVRVVHVRAGPAHFVRKEALLPYMAEFARNVIGAARDARERGTAYSVCHAHFFMSGLVQRLLGKRARRRACDCFTWRQVARSLADVYAEVAATAPLSASYPTRAQGRS